MPGFIGLPELIVLGVVVLLIFGPKRLPEMGRGLGKGLREFKDSVTGEEKTPDHLTVASDMSAYEVHEPETTKVS